MRKIACFTLVILLFASLFSCQSEVSALDVAMTLKYMGKISGNVYFSGAEEGSDHYIDSDMMKSLFSEDEPPENFAVILSSGIDLPYEIMIIIPQRGEDVIELADVAERRLVLLTGDGGAAPVVTGNFIAYSTVALDIDLEKTLRKIIT